MSLINQPPLLQTDASLTGWGGGEGGGVGWGSVTTEKVYQRVGHVRR